MRYYNIKIEDVENKSITELSRANIKVILHTLKSLCKNNIEPDLISNNGKKVRIAHDQFNKEVSAVINKF
jgi:hypothetical protein